MQKLALAAIVASTLAGSSPFTAAAGPAARGPDGVRCGFTSTTNPNAEANTQTGEIHGGPLVTVDWAGNTQSGTLTCTIQVGANTTHAAADAPGGKVSNSGIGVIVVPPSVVSYPAAPTQDVYLCAQFTYTGGSTVYWHANNSGQPFVTEHWSTDPNSECGLAISASTPAKPGPVKDLELLIDSIICPVLKTLLPPDGDVPLIWDCPPYGSGTGAPPQPVVRGQL